MTTKIIAQSSIHYAELRWQKHIGWHIPANGNVMLCGISLDPARRVLSTTTQIIRADSVCPVCLKRAQQVKGKR